MVKLGSFTYPSADFYTVIGIFDEAIRSEPITRNIHMATNIDIWHETFIYLGRKDLYNFRIFSEAIGSLFSLTRDVQVDVETFVTPAVSSYEVAEFIITSYATHYDKVKKPPRVTLINYDKQDEKKLVELLKKV